ncbi:MAG: DUF4126 domain-containing protein [Candidatus Eremiobacteraeota bacterium]|nr:DUF4126 domain-containing protein [Candidatus Eremiobacteraeota bacterium]MBC5827361.1 DUF4126 domain-containing protein [Candidatus Eremiobacteraeota bacterium]
MDSSTQYALAYALSTTAGLRGFLTLLAASVAAHAGWIHPGAGFAWLGSTHVTELLAVFATGEFVGDKIPVVDHVLHAVYLAARPLIGAILVGGTVHSGNPMERDVAMGVGALNALVVHSASSATRAGSSAVSLGAGTPLISLIEDAATVAGIIVAFIQPFVAAVLAAVLLLTLLWTTRSVVRGIRGRRRTSTHGAM